MFPALTAKVIGLRKGRVIFDSPTPRVAVNDDFLGGAAITEVVAIMGRACNQSEVIMSIAERLKATWSGVGTHVVVLSHGFGLDQTSWADLRLALDARFRVLSYNLAGCGDDGVSSYHPDVHNSLFGYADDLLALLDETQAHKVSYVGHSVSGMIGLIAAVARPDCFRRLILLQPSPRYLNDPGTGYVGGFEQSDLDMLYEAMATNYQTWAAGFVPMVMGVNDQHLLSQFSETLFKIRPDIAGRILKMIFQSDHRAIVPRISVPTHLIHSRTDVAVPMEVARWLHARLPGSTSETLELAGHMPHLTQPLVVLDAVMRHLSRE